MLKGDELRKAVELRMVMHCTRLKDQLSSDSSVEEEEDGSGKASCQMSTRSLIILTVPCSSSSLDRTGSE
jgi:hypothetical protein